MSKPIPGPWHVIELAEGAAFAVASQHQTKVNFISTQIICRVSDMATPAAEATAHLIAAAPEMLRLLEIGCMACDRRRQPNQAHFCRNCQTGKIIKTAKRET